MDERSCEKHMGLGRLPSRLHISLKILSSLPSNPSEKLFAFRPIRVEFLAAGAERIITSIKMHSARGRWLFGVTTYTVLSSLHACRFFSYVYIQSVTLGQLWAAQDSSQEVWFLQPCCPLVVVVGCGLGGGTGGQQPQVRCCLSWNRTQRKLAGVDARLGGAIMFQRYRARGRAALCY